MIMARRLFGGDNASMIVDSTGAPRVGSTGTAWTDMTRTTQVTDLTDITGTVLGGGTITADAFGFITFYGSADGRDTLYVDFGRGGLKMMTAVDTTSRVGVAETSLAVNTAGLTTVNAVLGSGSAGAYANVAARLAATDTKLPAAPAAGDVGGYLKATAPGVFSWQQSSVGVQVGGTQPVTTGALWVSTQTPSAPLKPSIVGSTVSAVQTSVTTATITVPTSVVIGDLLILFVHYGSAASAYTDPAGWNVLPYSGGTVTPFTGSSGAWLRVFTRVVAAGDAGSIVSFGLGGSQSPALSMVAIRNATIVSYNPYQDTAGATAGTATIQPTVLTEGQMALGFATYRGTAPPTAIVLPSAVSYRAGWRPVTAANATNDGTAKASLAIFGFRAAQATTTSAITMTTGTTGRTITGTIIASGAPQIPGTRTLFALKPFDFVSGGNKTAMLRDEATLGFPNGAARIFYANFDRVVADTTARSFDLSRNLVISFKAPTAQFISGALDTQMIAFLASLPTNVRCWITYLHEPQDEIRDGIVFPTMTATVTAGTTSLSMSQTHYFALNDRVAINTITQIGGGTVSGFATATIYYVVSLGDGTTFQLSTTAGGTAITPGGAGAATFVMNMKDGASVGGSTISVASNQITLSGATNGYTVAILKLVALVKANRPDVGVCHIFLDYQLSQSWLDKVSGVIPGYPNAKLWSDQVVSDPGVETIFWDAYAGDVSDTTTYTALDGTVGVFNTPAMLSKRVVDLMQLARQQGKQTGFAEYGIDVYWDTHDLSGVVPAGNRIASLITQMNSMRAAGAVLSIYYNQTGTNNPVLTTAEMQALQPTFSSMVPAKLRVSQLGTPDPNSPTNMFFPIPPWAIARNFEVAGSYPPRPCPWDITCEWFGPDDPLIIAAGDFNITADLWSKTS